MQKAPPRLQWTSSAGRTSWSQFPPSMLEGAGSAQTNTPFGVAASWHKAPLPLRRSPGKTFQPARPKALELVEVGPFVTSIIAGGPRVESSTLAPAGAARGGNGGSVVAGVKT